MPGVRLALVLLSLLLTTACSVNVIPVATSTATINPADNSITETRHGVAVTARIDELSVSPYQMVDNITSFHVVIKNATESQLPIDSKAFLLKDGQQRQYRSIRPEEVREIVSKDTVYLIPYPYVGYYYLEDYAKVTHFDTFSSALPFYAEYHPQDIFTMALPEGPVLPGSEVAGVVYFLADLERTDRAELLIYKDASLNGEPLFQFQFRVE